MATNTLFPKVTAAPQARSRKLRTYPNQVGGSKVWTSVLRSARTSVRVANTCENTDPTNHEKIN